MLTTESQPHYGRPPVIEVVCGVQFAGTEGWASPHYGKFWGLVESSYPKFEEQPPLPRLRVDPPSVEEATLSVLPALRRVFFIAPEENYLIQVQQGRFLFNWRKVRPEDEYPRFAAVYGRFVENWEVFKQFLSESKLGEAQPDTFELTYINHIMKERSVFPRDVWDFLAFYKKLPESTATPEASGMVMHFSWPLPNGLGILTMDIKHGQRLADKQQVLLIELTAKGKPSEAERKMEDWFKVAHGAIVNTFDRLTTSEAHTLWEKIPS